MKFGPQVVAAVVVLSSAIASSAVADTTFTDSTAFQNAAIGSITVVDFDSTSAGTAIPNASIFGGVTFDYASIYGATLQVRDDFITTSGANYLGTDDTGDSNLIADGDQVDFTFGTPIAGFGLYLIGSAADQLSGDYTLTFGGSTASFDVNATQVPTFADGGDVWFLGVISSAGLFTSATLKADSGLGGGAFFFNIDDLQLIGQSAPSAAPLPSSILLLLAGACSAAGIRGYGWRRRRSHMPSNKSSEAV